MLESFTTLFFIIQNIIHVCSPFYMWPSVALAAQAYPASTLSDLHSRLSPSPPPSGPHPF